MYAFIRRTLRLEPAQGWRYRPLRPQPSIVAPPSSLHADSVYVKYICAREFPVLGTARVSDAALLKANDSIRKLFAYRHDILKGLISQGVRLVVLGQGEYLRDLPEFRGSLHTVFADDLRFLDYDPIRKLMVVPEENVLGLPGDPFAGECMTISACARAMHVVLGQRPVDPAFEQKADRQQYELRVRRMDVRFGQELKVAFAQASHRSLWKGTPAARECTGYWAVGVAAYFDASGDGQAPVGAVRPITTREALKAYDPGLYRLVDGTMAYGEHVDWRFRSANAAAPCRYSHDAPGHPLKRMRTPGPASPGRRPSRGRVSCRSPRRRAGPQAHSPWVCPRRGAAPVQVATQPVAVRVFPSAIPLQ